MKRFKPTPCTNPECKGGHKGAHVQDARYALVEGGPRLCRKCLASSWSPDTSTLEPMRAPTAAERDAVKK